MFAVDEPPCVVTEGADAYPRPTGIPGGLSLNLPGVGRGISKAPKEKALGNPSQPTVTMGHPVRPSRSFDPREAGVSPEDEKALRDILRDKDLIDSLNLKRMMEGIVVATQAPLHLTLVNQLADLNATHARVLAEHREISLQLQHAQTLGRDADQQAVTAQTSERKAKDDLVLLKAKLVDATRCGEQHLRDSNSYRSQMVIAEEARSSRPAPPVGNDRYDQLVQEHAELTHQYAMIKDLLNGCTQRVKEGQQAALKIRELQKTIEALEAQAIEDRKKLATAERKDRKSVV